MAKVIEGLYYSESHEFVRVEGDYGFVGITDYAPARTDQSGCLRELDYQSGTQRQGRPRQPHGCRRLREVLREIIY